MLRWDAWWDNPKRAHRICKEEDAFYGIAGRAAPQLELELELELELRRRQRSRWSRHAILCRTFTVSSDALFDGRRFRLLEVLDRLHHTNSQGLSPISPAPLHKQFISAPSLGGRVHPVSEPSQAAKQVRYEPG